MTEIDHLHKPLRKLIIGGVAVWHFHHLKVTGALIFISLVEYNKKR